MYIYGPLQITGPFSFPAIVACFFLIVLGWKHLHVVYFSHVVLGSVQIFQPQSYFSHLSPSHHCRQAYCPPVTRMNIDERPTQRSLCFRRKHNSSTRCRLSINKYIMEGAEFGSKWERDPRERRRFLRRAPRLPWRTLKCHFNGQSWRH